MVCVFFATGFEEIEALTVIDLLRRASIDVQMVSIEDKLQITGAHGITVVCDKLIDDIMNDSFDMLVCPGGMPGTMNLKQDNRLALLLQRQNEKGGYIAAICAAPIIFEELGFLAGKHAVCYPDREEQLKSAIVGKEKVVKDGNVITSRGLGTAIEFAGKIISVLKNEKLAQQILEDIIY